MSGIKIETHKIVTAMGTLNTTMSPSSLPFLNKEEREEFDKIGESGRDNDGNRTTYHKFLNSLGKGTFDIDQTRFGSADCIDKYTITRAYIK